MIIDKLIERLPSRYKKETNSNNYKTLKLAADKMQENEDTLKKIEQWRDIDQAQGHALDILGLNAGEKRNGKDDIEYRKAIKTKRSGNLSHGSIEQVIEVSKSLLKDNLVAVEENPDGEPAAIKIKYKAIPEMFEMENINRVVAAGVRVIDGRIATSWDNLESLSLIWDDADILTWNELESLKV